MSEEQANKIIKLLESIDTRLLTISSQTLDIQKLDDVCSELKEIKESLDNLG